MPGGEISSRLRRAMMRSQSPARARPVGEFGGGGRALRRARAHDRMTRAMQPTGLTTEQSGISRPERRAAGGAQALPAGGGLGSCVIDGSTWLVRADFRPLLERVEPGAWLAPERQRGWTCVKRNSLRSVWRVRIDGRLCYAKLFAAGRLPDRIKGWLRRRGAAAELASVRFAAEHGIAAPRPLAYCAAIAGAQGRSAALITEAVEPAEPLDAYWASLAERRTPAEQRAVRAALLESLAELIARAHQAGFEHLDMHAANLLVREERGAPRAYFVDLQSAHLDRAVSDAAVVRNLAQLNQWFRRHSSIKDRIRFLRAYLRWRDEYRHAFRHARTLGLELRALVRALVAQAERHAQRLWRRRDRRVWRDGRYFARVRLPGGWRGMVVQACKRTTAETHAIALDLPSGWWRTALGDVSKLLDGAAELAEVAAPANPAERADAAGQGGLACPTGAAEHPIACKQSHSAWVARRALVTPAGPLGVIVKRPRARDRRRALRQLLPPSRAARGWRIGHALLNRNIATARPLALLERRLGPLVLESVLITEQLDGALDLAAHLRRERADRSPRAWRRHKHMLTGLLARELRKLHEAGFVHRDCKAENLLVLPGGYKRVRPPGAGRERSGAERERAGAAAGRVRWTRPRLVWIDMDGLRLPGRAPREGERLAALARLHVSLLGVAGLTRTDRLRFLRTWCGGFGADPRAWRRTWRALEPLIAAKLAAREARRAWKLEHYGRV